MILTLVISLSVIINTAAKKVLNKSVSLHFIDFAVWLPFYCTLTLTVAVERQKLLDIWIQVDNIDEMQSYPSLDYFETFSKRNFRISIRK